MLYQEIVTLVLVAIILNVILNLRSLRKPQRDAIVSQPQPLVSVLIPARNEEENIRACLNSVLRQDYRGLEVLVLDDSSVDRTCEIVLEVSRADRRVRLLVGRPLPAGWAGKPHACYQLACEAKGEWLLFLDADTVHVPWMVRSVLAAAIESQAALVSGFPRQMTPSLSLRTMIPMMYFMLFAWLPLWLTWRSRLPRPSVAVGQFMLFRTEDYWRMGGHKAVRSRIIEDVALGIAMIRSGRRHETLDLSSVVFTTMYKTFGAMWEGWTKWLYSVALISRIGLLAMIVSAFVVFLAPFLWLAKDVFMNDFSSEWRGLVVVQVAIVLAVRLLVDRRFHQSLASSLLHPVGFSLLVANGVYAGWRQLSRAGVRWKDRLYQSDSEVK
ncbi:MAG: glycosyltransferase [Chloroflexota bacterium]